MRPFGCPVTILNTIDHLGKFYGGFFVRYSLNSKAFRVFNSRTRKVEENLHIRFSENTPNAVGTQSNGFAGTKASDNADLKSYHDDGFKPSSDDIKKVDEDPKKDSECIDQEKKDNVNNTNTVNAASTNEVNTVSGKTSIELPVDPNMPELEDYSIFEDDENDGGEADMNNLDKTIQPHKQEGCQRILRNMGLLVLLNKEQTIKNFKPSNEVNTISGKTSIELPVDPNMPELEDYSIFEDDENDGGEADMNNLDKTIQVSPNLTTRIHKDHPLD
ncbi:hypothetical protein Tco_0844568 [Tanacetum coccineum]